jgi:hypothetical protein
VAAPAGLSAALVLARARRTVAVVDAGGPRNAPAAHMHGFLSRDGMPPHDLVAAGRAEVAGYGGSLIDDTVVDVAPGFMSDWPAARPCMRRVLRDNGLSITMFALFLVWHCCIWRPLKPTSFT